MRDVEISRQKEQKQKKTSKECANNIADNKSVVLVPKVSISLTQSPHHSKKRTRVVNIALFSGSKTGTLQWCENALAEFIQSNPQINFHVECVTNKTVRENKSGQFTSPMDVVRWCQASDAYFLVSQGMWLGMVTSGTRSDGWTVAGIANALSELSCGDGHGYPSGPNLFCPIWNGDKIRYLKLIADFAIPTMELVLPDNIDKDNFPEIAEQIRE